MQSIPVIRSQWCQRRIPCSRLILSKKGQQWVLTWLGCPTCTEDTRPIWLTQVVFFRGADVLEFAASLKWNPNSPSRFLYPFVGNQRQSPASILLWGSNGNAPQPSPSPTSRICKWEHSSLPQIGDLVSTDQPFGLSVAEYGFQGGRSDGILGLNYPKQSWSRTIPIFDKLKNEGALSEPVFAFYLSK